jgi:hypothetical protein
VPPGSSEARTHLSAVFSERDDAELPQRSPQAPEVPGIMVAVSSAPSLPWRTRCGASSRWWGGGGGWLTIAPGTVEFEFDRISGALFGRGVVRAVPPVVMVTARLLPPGFNSGLVIHGETRSVRVLMWTGDRGSVLKRLAAANVPVVERRTWVSLGTRIARHRLTGQGE